MLKWFMTHVGRDKSPERLTETVRYDWCVIREEIPSKIGLCFSHTVERGFLCPRCKMALPGLEHSETVICVACGLSMQRFGNALKCTGLEV